MTALPKNLRKWAAIGRGIVARRSFSRVGFSYGSCASDPGAPPGEIEPFARALAGRLGHEEAVPFAFGRMAFYAILRAIRIEPGDEVVIPAFTCRVVADAIAAAGGRPVYVDIDADTMNMDLRLLGSSLGPRTRVVVAQHTFGSPIDVAALRAVLLERLAESTDRVLVVEDCAHALGAELRGEPVGAAGDAAFVSTETTKMICTEIGGAAVARAPALLTELRRIERESPELPPDWQAALVRRHRFLATHLAPGRFWGPGEIATRLHRPEAAITEYVRRVSGPDALVGGFYPARFPRVFAGLGAAQLADLPANLAHRRRIAEQWRELFRNHPTQSEIPGGRSSWLRFPLLVDDPERWRRRFERYVPLGDWCDWPVYGATKGSTEGGYQPGSCPVAERVGSRIVNFPTHQRVDETIVRQVERLYRRGGLG